MRRATALTERPQRPTNQQVQLQKQRREFWIHHSFRSRATSSHTYQDWGTIQDSISTLATSTWMKITGAGSSTGTSRARAARNMIRWCFGPTVVLAAADCWALARSMDRSSSPRTACCLRIHSHGTRWPTCFTSNNPQASDTPTLIRLTTTSPTTPTQQPTTTLSSASSWNGFRNDAQTISTSPVRATVVTTCRNSPKLFSKTTKTE
mmetsp:Transcript_15150/g.41914  ORF Transcript_15150/g.41914 Transcript_15150/m.41914 type:complete len:207 (+) Transcript_15150:268-888(+)